MAISDIFKTIARLRFLGGLTNTGFKPGHFYSPVVSLKDIKKRESKIWKDNDQIILPEIELNSDLQTNLIKEVEQYYKDLPFKSYKEKHRYYYDNIFFSYSDAILLYSVIRHFKPKRIIEAGSGFSSALMLDTGQYFSSGINFSFIEPYPKRLRSLLNDDDKKMVRILEKKIQDVDLSVFEELQKGDIFFVDSTHISKTGSDVNHILFEVLPILKKGVLIHFHDIFYPFEYSKKWVYQGRSWNENYILRAFLMNNNRYKIILFADYLHKHHKNAFESMPLCYENTGGSLWLEKTND